MPRTWIDMGCSGMLSPEAGRGLQRVRALFNSRGQDLYVMSVGEGDHGMASRHYGCPIAFSDAWDQRPNSIILPADIRKEVGPDFDVVDERNHIHIEYDPK